MKYENLRMWVRAFVGFFFFFLHTVALLRKCGKIEESGKWGKNWKFQFIENVQFW